MAKDSSHKVVYVAIASNFGIAVTKFAAALYTGSTAMLGEAVHSLVDTGNEALILVGLKRSTRPADERHPFGHSRELYFWSFVVALMLFIGGAVVATYEGIEKILHPSSIGTPWVNYIVLGVSAMFEGYSWHTAWVEFQETRGDAGIFETVHASKDPTVFIVLFEDSAALLGLATAFAGILASELLDMPVFDGVSSVLIGLILGTTAILLAYETKSLLIGEAAHPALVRGVREIIQGEHDVDRVNDILSTHFGPDDVLLNVSLDFGDPVPASRVEAAVSRIEAAVKDRYPEVSRIFIEVQSWQPHRQAQAS
jgi:cation diffusion facilitator family transporter